MTGGSLKSIQHHSFPAMIDYVAGNQAGNQTENNPQKKRHFGTSFAGSGPTEAGPLPVTHSLIG
jgi:hypothetical protein